MGNKFLDTVFGLMLLLLSFKILLTKQFIARGMYFDFSNDFISILAGFSCFIVGVAWLYSTYRKKSPQEKDDKL
jgi:hypothetical protein